jgi:hypothetical protein
MAFSDLHSLKLTDTAAANLSSRLLQAVEDQPQVRAAGLIDMPPFSGSFGASRLFSIDRDHVIHSDPSVFYLRTSSGYFAAVGTGVLAGDPAASISGVNVCVLSRSSASFFFPRESAIHQLVYFSTWPKPDGTELDLKSACRVTAVVEDAKFVSLRQPAPRIFYQVYRPEESAKNFAEMNHLIVRANSDALAMSAIQIAARRVLPPGVEVKIDSMTDMMHQDLSRERMLVSVSTVFAVLALLLTALGLYGLLMRTVTLRTREIGIRVALGSQRGAILLSIGRRAMAQAALGLAAGTVISQLASQAVRQLLDVKPEIGISNLILSAAAMLIVAALAVIAPVRRAASVDPMQALRSE